MLYVSNLENSGAHPVSKDYGNIFTNSRFGGGPSAAMVGERATRAEDQWEFWGCLTKSYRGKMMDN